MKATPRGKSYFTALNGATLEDVFPDAWERMQIQKLAVEERTHAKRILDLYPDLKLS